jgi:hypothetical protein
MKNFGHVDSMATNNARYTRETKSIISIAAAAFNKMKELSTSKLDSILWKNRGSEIPEKFSNAVMQRLEGIS